MRKILILANNSVGLYNFRFELIQRLIQQGVEVYFTVPQLINDEKVKLIIEAGANYVHTPMSRRGMNPLEDLKLISNYKQIIKQVNPDIILTYTIKPNIYGGYVANKVKKPVMMNITGLGSSLVTSKLRGIIKKMYKYVCGKSSNVFFQNEGNQDFFISNKLVSQDKVILIPGSGVNTSKFKPLEDASKGNQIKFLFIARLMKEKGIEEYLRAAENITRNNTNVIFQILGSYEEEIYKDIILNNKNKQIQYLGISNDVRKEIKVADCIVNPSYHEGMSNVLLEGGAMAKPLIASNIPGCREIIDDGYNGYLFKVKSADALEEKLLKFIKLSEKEKEVMGLNSRSKVEKEFDRNIVVDEYIKTINKILKDGC